MSNIRDLFGVLYLGKAEVPANLFLVLLPSAFPAPLPCSLIRGAAHVDGQQQVLGVEVGRERS